jgi:sarcosine oxidase
MRIAVIGIGGTGSAAARHLAKAGHEVVGYEQFRLGHERGSSHGESRIIRYTYPDSLYTRMMEDAYPLWRELEAESGEDLLGTCGGLFFGAQDDPKLAQTEDALRASGLQYDRLSGTETSARFPAIRLGENEAAIYQPDSGYLRSTRCVLANARLARQHGAAIHEETPVTRVEQRGDEVVVQTADGSEERFDRAIVTAGAWMGDLLKSLGLKLRVTRQQIVYLAIGSHEEAFQPGAMPVWIDSTANYYGFPSDGVIPGIKLASHTQGNIIDPADPRRVVDADYIESVVEYAQSRFPDLTDQLTFSVACLYTNTANEDFILDHVPGSPNIVMVSGCSGHGFKFTVLLGEIAARLATGRSYERPLERFEVARFQ